MKKLLRRNLLIDLGKPIDQLGADIIITPDKYKRLDNFGVIRNVSPGCRLFSKSDIGKKVICSTFHREDSRFSPTQSVKLSLNPHWHFIIPEQYIDALLE